MKNEKQIKVGSLVRLTRAGAIQWVPGAKRLYGIVRDTRHFDYFRSQDEYLVHLHNGDEHWIWNRHFEVLA